MDSGEARLAEHDFSSMVHIFIYDFLRHHKQDTYPKSTDLAEVICFACVVYRHVTSTEA